MSAMEMCDCVTTRDSERPNDAEDTEPPNLAYTGS